MRNIVRTLVIFGAAALALTATPARADGGEWREPREAGGDWREQREAGGDWREHRHQDREQRREWRDLAEARERFYASWQGNPWRRLRFERWYHHRRDELVRWESNQRQQERDCDRPWQR